MQQITKKVRVSTESDARAVLAKIAAVRAANKQVLFDKTAKPLTEKDWEFFETNCRKHPKQLDLLKSTARFKALLCPRRMGKSTYTLFETLLHAKKFPGSTIMYIVPDSKGHARRLFWRPLMIMNSKFELGLQFHETDKRVTTPEGTDILLFGAHDKDAAVQLRGDASGVSLAMLDECKDFGPHFEEVVVQAVLPALGDYQGTLVMAGTPGNILDGLFYNLTKPGASEEGWQIARWVKSDNGYLPPEERDLEQVWKTAYKPFGLTKESPAFRREQLGEWCTDESERVYLYDNVRNHYAFDGEGIHGLPVGPHGQPHDWQFCMACDFGERDKNAIVVGAFAQTSPHLFVVAEYARSHMAIHEIANKIREFEAKFGTMCFIVGDSGGYGRPVVTELANQHNIPIVPADKGKNKLGNVALMNSDFLLGRIKADKNSATAKEWLKLSKRVRITDKKVLLEHSDLGDAALYMYRASLHWASKEMETLPLPNTQEYWYKQEREAIEHASKNHHTVKPYGAPSERS